ncbi:hypothetical protein ARTHRO_30051 [Limnospira indica PCC 8005]|uniref:Uncharacterized protein n=1 Tax=Limnospira indica PCC 8005 TaxID=376219 RepID=A0A9P1KEY3_9CYAN|nr:hypothetical protein ARTHRO_30051 [Limnospira indica PCC 8005]
MLIYEQWKSQSLTYMRRETGLINHLNCLKFLGSMFSGLIVFKSRVYSSGFQSPIKL